MFPKAWRKPFDPVTNTIQLREQAQSGDEDLLDTAAIQTFLNAGTVYALEREEMPENAPLAAIFRYARESS